MTRTRPGLPRFDATLTTANVHERAEQVAVPDFDWMTTPVLAIVDALLHIDMNAPLPRRPHRFPQPAPIPHPAGAPTTPPIDIAAHSACHFLADLTRIHR
ncbi:hypothetical protein Q0Z83_108960 [Actinoplanes sichuanensis]|uniref:Uncharacterized protein n=1 Tax=Actinoplanes sichuanensis TaxID=512349 RepID=A0ABW4A3S0_9ACTN|nr:hypothetical protein [Actinoplanes sichuanensis]BEL12705.1 hypothetical protein Q0Z83_108960 [Actinoplanes sichuanensis]